LRDRGLPLLPPARYQVRELASRLAQLDPERLPEERRKAVEEKLKELLALLEGEE